VNLTRPSDVQLRCLDREPQGYVRPGSWYGYGYGSENLTRPFGFGLEVLQMVYVVV